MIRPKLGGRVGNSFRSGPTISAGPVPGCVTSPGGWSGSRPRLAGTDSRTTAPGADHWDRVGIVKMPRQAVQRPCFPASCAREPVAVTTGRQLKTIFSGFGQARHLRLRR